MEAIVGCLIGIELLHLCKHNWIKFDPCQRFQSLLVSSEIRNKLFHVRLDFADLPLVLLEHDWPIDCRLDEGWRLDIFVSVLVRLDSSNLLWGRTTTGPRRWRLRRVSMGAV